MQGVRFLVPLVGVVAACAALCMSRSRYYRAQNPVDVHYGRAADIVAARQVVLDAVYARHPERFPLGRPTQKRPPAAAWINP